MTLVFKDRLWGCLHFEKASRLGGLGQVCKEQLLELRWQPWALAPLGSQEHPQWELPVSEVLWGHVREIKAAPCLLTASALTPSVFCAHHSHLDLCIALCFIGSQVGVLFYALHSGHQFLFHSNHSCHLLTEYDSYSGPDRGERFTGRLEDHNAKNTENKESQTAIPFEKLIWWDSNRSMDLYLILII